MVLTVTLLHCIAAVMTCTMLGFVTAIETFCGQALGAQLYTMVGLVLNPPPPPLFVLHVPVLTCRMLGFVTAMETFCGQAFGAQRYKMVGLVLQRGLIISSMYCCVALWTWQFNYTLLVAMGQVC